MNLEEFMDKTPYIQDPKYGRLYFKLREGFEDDLIDLSEINESRNKLENSIPLIDSNGKILKKPSNNHVMELIKKVLLRDITKTFDMLNILGPCLVSIYVSYPRDIGRCLGLGWASFFDQNMSQPKSWTDKPVFLSEKQMEFKNCSIKTFSSESMCIGQLIFVSEKIRETIELKKQLQQEIKEPSIQSKKEARL